MGPKNNFLQDKVILVTGASRGIGRAVAKAYAQHGATVILLARTITDLEALATEISEENNATAINIPAIYPFNLATATANDYDELRRKLDQHYGRLDGLLHNAGMLGTLTPIEQYPLETWYQVLQVNLNSVFLLTKALLPLLKRSSAASLIFTGIEPKYTSKAYWGAYAVAYAGVNSLMQILSDEYSNSNNIRCNQVIPQQVNTKLKVNAFPALNADQLVTPEAILHPYLYLMSDHSKTITSQVFFTDQSIDQLPAQFSKYCS